MPQTYHVHVHRELRLTISPVTADSPEQAAEVARHLPTDEALSIDDCDGATLAALVDHAGGDRFEPSARFEFAVVRPREPSAGWPARRTA